MATAYSTNPQPYILKEDREKDEEHQSVFQLKGLTNEQWDNLVPKMWGKNTESINLLGSSATKIVKMILKGWDNFKDENGDDIEFSQKMSDNLNRLSAGMRMEFALEAINRQQLTEDESKN